MKVALLTAHMSRRAGGVWEFIRHLAGDLPHTGVVPAVIGLHDRRAPDEDMACLGDFDVVACNVTGPEAFGFSRGLLPALRQVSPDVVHAQGIWMYPSLASLRWHRRSKRPYMVAPHGMLDSWALGRASIKKRVISSWFEREHLRSASCLHALNEAEAIAIRAQGLVNPICILPNGVSVPPNTSANKPAWAEELEPGTRILLYLGRLHPKKGLVALVNAWQRVQAHAEREGWCLIIAGWDQGGHARDLLEFILEFCPRRTVRLVGPQFDLDKDASFRAASAFILPSLSEGLPVGVLEAWSYGLPVLMTRQCNLQEGFAAGAAVEFKPEISSIADGLQALFRMPAAERDRIGQRGRQLVEDRFRWDRIATEMSRVYAWLLGGGSPPACVMAPGGTGSA
jgi:glycosyltransferase involved in cell wall biosynthesis